MGSLVSSMRFPCIPFLSKQMFHLSTVQEERDLMAGGVAAGVSSAFGSPVGKSL